MISDDRWRDSYDTWKLATPPEYDYIGPEPEDDCIHEDYETDILTGLATCSVCGHRWYQTDDEVAAEHRRAVQYEAWQRRENRRERIRPLMHPLRKLIERFWPRRRFVNDDDIPF